MTSREIARKACSCLDEKKAVDIKVIDISRISIIADYFIIAGGTNIRQVKSLADNVEEKLDEAGVHYSHREGYSDGEWILLDYGDVVVHIFRDESRAYYALEKLWGDAEITRYAD